MFVRVLVITSYCRGIFITFPPFAYLLYCFIIYLVFLFLFNWSFGSLSEGYISSSGQFTPDLHHWSNGLYHTLTFLRGTLWQWSQSLLTPKLSAALCKQTSLLTISKETGPYKVLLQTWEHRLWIFHLKGINFHFVWVTNFYLIFHLIFYLCSAEGLFVCKNLLLRLFNWTWQRII